MKSREHELEAALRRMVETFGPLVDAINPGAKGTAVAQARRVLARPGARRLPAQEPLALGDMPALLKRQAE